MTHAAPITVRLPNDWRPRPYQMPAWAALERGVKRVVPVWHRRAGKDTISLHWCARSVMMRVGVYWHVLPTLRQGRRIIWEGQTKEGRPFLDAFPKQLILKPRNDEMTLRFRHPTKPGQPGSLYQVVGSDNVDALVGANPIGVVMSEYALQDPRAWELIMPILAENGGWAIFPYTPRGRNHGYRLFQNAQASDDWFSERLTIDDTGVLGPDDIRQAREGGMSEAMIQQEFYCSWDAPLEGAYYADLLLNAESEGRIGDVPHDPARLVQTWWDIGYGDSTAIWFVQHAGNRVFLIDYHEDRGHGVEHYVGVLQRKAAELGYNYGSHIGPHDLDSGDWATGRKRIDVAKALGVRFMVAPKVAVDDGIQAVRSMLPRCWFDAKRCQQGLDALRAYRAEKIEDRGREGDVSRPFYSPKPVHDWASHGADALRYGAVGGKEDRGKREPIKYLSKGAPL